MAANTVMMYFKVDPSVVQKKEFRHKVEQLGELALGTLQDEPVVMEMGSNGDALFVFTGKGNSHALMRLYSHGLLTVDVEYLVKDFNSRPYTLEDMHDKEVFALGGRKLQLSDEYIRTLELRLKDNLIDYCMDSNSLLSPVKRGMPVWPYTVTADDRLMEQDYDSCVYDKNSRWQNVSILHSQEHGNVLFLDRDIMLAESDLIYTQTVAGIGTTDYRNKEVLILGGGDGGLLHELLKEKPKMVIMAEIDDMVIQACREHMRPVCGDAMDSYEGPHHKILIEDCVKVLHEAIQSGKQYDYVINDLTEFPLDKALKGYCYDFATTSLITELCTKVVKPEGRLFARGNCLSATDYRMRLEDDIKKMGLEFIRKDVYVPSFHETYCLYEMWYPTGYIS